VDNLLAAIPRKEREMAYEEVVAYITKKYSKTKRKKEPVAPPPKPPAPKKPHGDLRVIKIKKG
jgi:hypothetical protein